MEYHGWTYKSVKAPCRECEERYPGCHDHCEKYQQALKEWEDFKTHVRKEKQDEFNHYRVSVIRAEMKRRSYGRKQGK